MAFRDKAIKGFETATASDSSARSIDSLDFGVLSNEQSRAIRAAQRSVMQLDMLEALIEQQKETNRLLSLLLERDDRGPA